MLTYPHVEDYLEYLGGYEVGLTALITPHSVNRISLARYDIAIVNNMASTTVFGTALTDKQAELAVKLVLKYRRQFAKMGIDVAPVEAPVFRMAPRKMDRTRAVWLDDDHIVVKFPYDNDLIKELQSFREASQGKAWYDRDKKLWNLAITEYNVNWIVPWAESRAFEIDLQIQEMFAQILACEQQPYSIELVCDGDQYALRNAPDSLINYINEHLGGFGLDNIIKLIDYAGILGYTKSNEVFMDQRVSTDTMILGMFQSHNMEPTDENLNKIFNYAEETQRYPVCIYNPTLLDIDLSRFHEEEIVRFDRNGKTKTSDYDPYGVKVVYAQKIPTTWDFPVPLLVTTFEMMFGGRKLDWTKRAERIIYFTDSKLRNRN
jgi:hypothetical protein